jgi:hypothetical protein
MSVIDGTYGRRVASPLCTVAAIFAMLAMGAAHAQSTDRSTGGETPSGEGNVWDYKDHQPTEAEVEAAEKAAGTEEPARTGAQLDRSLERLQQEIEQTGKAYPPRDHAQRQTGPE